MNKALSEASLLVFAVPKSEIIGGDLSTLDTLVKRLTKNKEMTISKRASAEIFFLSMILTPENFIRFQKCDDGFGKQ